MRVLRMVMWCALLMAAGGALAVPLNSDSITPSLPCGVSGDWWSAVQRDIAASEYHVTWQEKTCLPDGHAGYQAPNRAHNLRTYFTPEGPRVVRRTEAEPTWTWGLELVGMHNEDAPPVEEVTAKGNRIEYRRGPALTEWYVNGPQGVEQGFTIAELGESSANSEAHIALDLAVRGDLAPGMMPDGETIEFLSPGGVGLIHYGHLKAYDAKGTELPARLELLPSDRSDQSDQSQAIRISVDASGAAFPITIDPLATSAAWTGESDQDYAYFGCSVSTAGDVNGDGYADVIVGAYQYDNGQMDEGRAYVYHGSANGLSPTAAWTAESDQAQAFFGLSVATAGDVNGDGYADVIVGARGYDNGETDEGRAYVYHGSAGGLSTTANWTAESDEAYVCFGCSVSTAGDVNGDGYADVIVGAPYYDNGQTNEGRAYVYHGSASGLSPTAAWTAASDQGSARFGTSVSTAGDVNGDGYADVIVGAPGYDNGEEDEGRAYVYQGSAGGLSATPAWSPESDQGSAYFGCSVSTAGDVNGDGYAEVIVGALLCQRPAGRGPGVCVSGFGGRAFCHRRLDGRERPGWRLFRHIGVDGRGREPGRVRRRDRGRVRLLQRPVAGGPGVCVPRFGQRTFRDGALDGGERPGRRWFRLFGFDGGGREWGRLRGRDRRRAGLQQRPRPGVCVPRCGERPLGDGVLDGRERPGWRVFRLFGFDGRGR